MTTPNDPSKTTLSNDVIAATLDLWRQTGQTQEVPVTGRSMLPLFRPGDFVTLEPTLTRPIGRGEVIVFREPNRLVIHRVIKQQIGPIYLTKGDNVLSYDAPVSAEQVLGRVRLIKRGTSEINLDTRWWRVAGWLIAISTLLWKSVYGLFRRLKLRFLGSNPNRVTGFIRQTAFKLFSFLRRTLQRILT